MINYIFECFNCIKNYVNLFDKYRMNKGSIINIAFCIAFINYLGLYAVAVASFVGFLITFLLRSRDFELKVDVKNFAFLLLGYILVFYITQFTESTNLRLIFIAVALISFILININIYQKLFLKNIGR